jgi:hypothetical protein
MLCYESHCDCDFVVQKSPAKSTAKSTASTAANSYVHQNWAVVDDEEQSEIIGTAGGTTVTEDNFRMLSSVNPRMRCVHCEKCLRWNPSTNRAKHLFTCAAYSTDPAWKDAKFQKDR